VIVAAGLLVLLGLGLFIAGVLTGATVLYWACVAACVLAAVVLVAVRRKPAATPAAAPTAAPSSASSSAAGSAAGTDPEGDTGTATPADTEAGSTETEADAREAPPVTATARREGGTTRTTAAAPASGAAVVASEADPEVEEVEVTDLLLVVDLTDEVLVVDEHPRYHVADCSWLAGRETIPLPVDEARTDGFTPCAVCSPDRTLAERARAKKHSSS
jgi:hypothetical protein